MFVVTWSGLSMGGGTRNVWTRSQAESIKKAKAKQGYKVYSREVKFKDRGKRSMG